MRLLREIPSAQADFRNTRNRPTDATVHIDSWVIASYRPCDNRNTVPNQLQGITKLVQQQTTTARPSVHASLRGINYIQVYVNIYCRRAQLHLALSAILLTQQLEFV